MPLVKGVPSGGPCGFSGCENVSRCAGYCCGHYQQVRGKRPLKPLDRRVQAPKIEPRPPVPHPSDPTAMLVPLTKGLFATIDAVDATAVGARNWFAAETRRGGGFYAASGAIPRQKLHLFLWEHWGMPETPEVDHRNGDGLDCRRQNLRAATHAQNMLNRKLCSSNTTGHRGVAFDKRYGTFAARSSVNGRYVHLGTFRTAEEAGRAYVEFSMRAHGEFSPVLRDALQVDSAE